MIGPSELLLAFLVDLAIGDPQWLPHPVRLMGKAISRSELFLRRHFSTPSGEKKAGIFLVLMIVGPSFLVTLALQEAIFRGLDRTLVFVGTILLVYLIASTIAVRELIRSAGLVIESVKDGSLVPARRKLSMIVGRDTESLSEQEVLKAVTETLAENLSDGVVAPLFYLALGGLPLAMTYKAINTLDSMVGYKNGTYINFGWAAARLDDIANYIPARITGLLIVLSVFVTAVFRRNDNPLPSACRAFRIMLRDGRNHTSPNSGIPEAAMAGGLGIRMGGPSRYGGILVDKPYIGETEKEGYLSASEDAIMLVQAASAMGVGIAAILLSLRSSL
ncbi:MAG: adenosylcobinamide-phosphate synthase CbiB [Thermodesulfovibrionales bacterium]